MVLRFGLKHWTQTRTPSRGVCRSPLHVNAKYPVSQTQTIGLAVWWDCTHTLLGASQGPVGLLHYLPGWKHVRKAVPKSINLITTRSMYSEHLPESQAGEQGRARAPRWKVGLV